MIHLKERRESSWANSVEKQERHQDGDGKQDSVRDGAAQLRGVNEGRNRYFWEIKRGYPKRMATVYNYKRKAMKLRHEARLDNPVLGDKQDLSSLRAQRKMLHEEPGLNKRMRTKLEKEVKSGSSSIRSPSSLVSK